MNSFLKNLIEHPEGRRREYKETLPAPEELAKTVIAFSNDAGGELFIGIKDRPRQVVGMPEEKLLETEEKIANLIADRCYPVILPEITFLNLDGPTVIRVKVYRGSQAPYYLKSKGKERGVYIRVGSGNRLATPEIVQELERLGRNISFDSVPVFDLPLNLALLKDFAQKYRERTGEQLDEIDMRKLQLLKTVNERDYFTHAALLLADREIKNRYFPYAKVECARFKGTNTDTFLDQATIDNSIAFHADEVVHFIRRNIARGSTLNGIYREDRWQYPLTAVREAVINAIIHRDYALQGKDIKVAIFDDMLEITSPGTAPPSIDLSADLPVGQSEIRNFVLAPIFKRLGLIEQWGTGFKKIKKSLEEYPEIELRIQEPGMAFQIQFVKKNYQREDQPATNQQAPRKLLVTNPQVREILRFCLEYQSRKAIQQKVGFKDREHFRLKILKPLLETGLLEMLYPQSPNNPRQKYKTTEKGKTFLAQYSSRG